MRNDFLQGPFNSQQLHGETEVQLVSDDANIVLGCLLITMAVLLTAKLPLGRGVIQLNKAFLSGVPLRCTVRARK